MHWLTRVNRIAASLIVAALLIGCSAPPPAPATPAALTPPSTPRPASTRTPTPSPLPTATPTVPPTSTPTPHPLSIQALRSRDYPGSEIVVEQTLDPGVNYSRYLASYQSDGLKIYALLTIPAGEKPASGWPVIVFNHGFIPPSQYSPTERYLSHVDTLARHGYIVFRPDYRGHGDSEGEPSGAYGSSGYAVDVLNALASVRRFPDADPQRIGMWGHSMGGFLTLRAMVVAPDIRAGVIWAGVVGSYPDMFSGWRRASSGGAPATPARGWRQRLLSEFGAPEENPEFWAGLSANSYLTDLAGPLQLHHGTADESVPYEFSATLSEQVAAAGQVVEFYTYDGADHNLTGYFTQAMLRTVEFFDKYLTFPKIGL